jgi:hypothetical protein
LATRLTELWSVDRPHLTVAEIADWFATYVYLPKLRDRVEIAIRDALAKLDPKFAYAEGFDEGSGKYAGLLWQKAPLGPMPQTALLVRPEVAMAQLRPVLSIAPPELAPTPLDEDAGPVPPITTGPTRDHNRGGSSGQSRSTWFDP